MIQSQIHSRVVADALKHVVAPIIDAGGTKVDVMVATESFLVGVAILCIRFGGDDTVLDVMVEGAQESR